MLASRRLNSILDVTSEPDLAAIFGSPVSVAEEASK